jgi:hypothetical protein
LFRAAVAFQQKRKLQADAHRRILIRNPAHGGDLIEHGIRTQRAATGVEEVRSFDIVVPAVLQVVFVEQGSDPIALARGPQVGEQRSFSTVREDALADSRRRCVLARGGQRDCASHNRDAGKSEVLEHGIHCGAGPRLARARETAPKKRTWASPSLPIFSARW